MGTEIKQNHFKVRVRKGSKELEIQIPLGQRNVIGMGQDGTGTAALKIMNEMIEKINEI